MAIRKEKKSEILAKLEGALKEATAAVFVGFDKLTVADASSMRRELKSEGIRYYVAKKTLIRRALAGQNYGGAAPELPGEVAVAWTAGADTTAPARLLHEYGKKLKGAVKLLGGIFDGAFQNEGSAVAVATIPPVPVLRGMFVNVINSPIQGLVIALDQIREQKA
ncbi:50S ribosomal protein L10 [Patescibacteria group bacterium]|nr:50S ribosomal protein L10 [Patescibacteria group bacterium]MDE1944164.1 50S ribosomal protein L10 [Patescibacteria group bacterium]MDE1945086.1 50S ribosomal protein L10 [Patescibacteria group bacterium]